MSATFAAAGPLSPLPCAPRAQAVFADIADPQLRLEVQTIVSHALVSLDALGEMHLPQDDFEAHTTGEVAPYWHLALAPQALATLSAINRLLAYVMQTFDAPAELHPNRAEGEPITLEFNTVADVPGSPAASGAARRAAAAHQLSQRGSAAGRVADVAHLLGALLRERVLAFGDGLRKAVALADTWPLLAELDDNKHRLSKAVQGLMYGVFGVFAPDVPREEIWPGYRSAVDEAVALRSALTDLTADMAAFDQALHGAASDQRMRLVRKMADHLAHFSSLAPYRGLRADDKKAIIDFRRTLLAMHRPASAPPPEADLALPQALADFKTFLGAMYAINHREVLILHDRQCLTMAAATLDELAGQVRLADDSAALARARLGLDAWVQRLRAVHGRSVELDAAVAAHTARSSGDAAELLRYMTEWQDQVQVQLAALA